MIFHTMEKFFAIFPHNGKKFHTVENFHPIKNHTP